MAEYGQVFQNRPQTTENSSFAASASMLDDHIWTVILEFLPALDLLQNVNRVSRRFAGLMDYYFWQSYSQRLLMMEKNSSNNNKRIRRHEWNLLQIQQVCVFVTSDWKSQNDNEQGKIERRSNSQNCYPCLFQQSLLPRADEAIRLKEGTTQRRVCLASSTHHTTSEAIEYTLSPMVLNRFTYRPTTPGWWSSLSSNSPDSREELFYVTSSHLTVMTQLTIKPLVDYFRGVLQVYSWDYTKITAYALPRSLIGSFGLPSIDCTAMTPVDSPHSDTIQMKALLKDQIPVYESSKLENPAIVPSGNTYENQVVIHDFPAGVVANGIHITLYGKRARERLGYYACVDHVKIKGIPLYSDRTRLLESLQEQKDMMREIQRRIEEWLPPDSSDSVTEAGNSSVDFVDHLDAVSFASSDGEEESRRHAEINL